MTLQQQERYASLYEAIEARIARLSTHQDKIFKYQIDTLLTKLVQLYKEGYCEEHLVPILNSYIRSEIQKHHQMSRSREALEVSLISIQMAVEIMEKTRNV